MKTNMMKTVNQIGCALIALATIATQPRHAEAAARTWLVTTGTWNVPGNWSGGAVPTSSDQAIVDSSRTVLVPASVSGTADTLYVGYSGTGALNINAGTVLDFYGYLGQLAGSSGTATITNGTWSNSNNLVVGGSGRGTLNLNGGTVSDNYGYLGFDVGSTGSATIASGTWSNNYLLYVGRSGTGTLNLNGGSVSVNSLGRTVNLAYSAGSAGTLNLGAGGMVGTLNALEVNGGSGSATVNFNHTASGYTFSPSLTGTLSVNQTGTGTTILTGSNTYAGATTASAGFFQIDANSRLGGSTLTLNGGGIRFGAAFNNLRAITLKTNWGTLDTNGFNVSYSQVISGSGGLIKAGLGTLTLTASNSYLAGTVIGSGTLAVATGGSINHPSWFGHPDPTMVIGSSSGDNGALTVSGGKVSDFAAYLGSEAGSIGSATVTSGTWSNGNGLSIGDSGTGILNINGGTVSAGYATLGYYAGSSGSATITSGSWGNSSFLGIGVSGMGTLNINGGNVSNSDGEIGSGADGKGTVTITSGTWNNGSGLIVGVSGAGTLNLTGNGIVTIASGTGTLTLAQNPGSNGTLNVGTGGTAGTLNAAVVSGGSGNSTVNFNHTGSITFAPMLTGNLSVGKFGTGTTILTASNTYAGTTTISSGTLKLGHTKALGDVSNPLAIDGGTLDLLGKSVTVGRLSGSNDALITSGSAGAVTFTVTQGSAATYAGQMQDGSGTLALAKAGSATLTIAGSNSYTGGTTIRSGTLAIATGGSINHSSANIIVGNSSGDNAALTISGGTLTGSNSFIANDAASIGAATITSGTWTNNDSLFIGASGSGTLNVNGGSVTGTTGYIGFGHGSNGTATVSNGTWSNSFNLIVGVFGNGTLNLNGGIVTCPYGFLGYNPGSNGTATITSGTWITSGILSVGYSGTGTLNANGGKVEVTGNLLVGENGTGSLNINGGSVTNAYCALGYNPSRSGTATITSGTWESSNLAVGQYGRGMLNINGGKVTDTGGYIGSFLGSNGTANVTGGTWSNSSTLYIGDSGNGTLNLTGSGNVTVASGSGTVTVGRDVSSTGTLNLGTGGTAGAFNAATVKGGSGTATVNFNHNNSGYTFSPALTGTLSVNQIGTGVTILTGSNTYAGTTTATAGFFQVDANSRLGSSTLTLNGGGIRFGAAFNDLRVFTLGTNGTTLDTNGFNVSYSPVISGSGLLAKAGAGTLTLTASNSYTGGTTIKSGTLAVATGGSINHSNAYVIVGNNDGDNGALNVIGGSVSDYLCNIGFDAGSNGSAAVTNGTWSTSLGFSVGESGTGTLNVSGGTVSDIYGFIGDLAGSTGNATISGGTWSNSSSLLVGVFGTGTLNLTGSGTVTIGSGTGTLILGQNAGSTGTLNIGAGGTAGTLSAAMVNGGSGTATVTFNHTASGYTFSPALTGTLSVNQTGTGTTILTGSNTYAGATTASAGFFQIDANSRLGGSTLTLNGGGIRFGAAFNNLRAITLKPNWGTLDTNGFNVSYSQAISGSGGLIKAGPGTLTLTASNSYAGSYIQSGTLRVNSGGSINDISLGSFPSIYFPSTTIGSASGDNGALSISGGSVSNFDVYLGSGSGSIGSATITSGTWSSSTLTIADSGTASLNVNGGFVKTGYSILGNSAGSNGSATITTGSWNNNNFLAVGASGTGTLNINGGTVSNSNGEIAASADGRGTVTITSGTWKNSGSLYVGESGTGTLNVNGGLVTGSTGYVGYDAGSNGTATVSSGTWSNSTALYVGRSGTGTLNLTGNGVVTIASGTGTLTIAQNAGSTGTLNFGTGGFAGTLNAATVNGGSGTATVNFNHNSSGYTFSPSLTGTLSVNQVGTGITILAGSNTYAGATTASAGFFQIDANSRLGSSTLTLNGGGIRFGAAFNDLRAFTLETNGGTLDTNGFNVSYAPVITGSGALTKAGAGNLTLTASNSYSGGTTIKSGALILNAGGSISHGAADMRVGHTSGDNGSLLISGGTVTDANGCLGYNAGSVGTATITSGTWSNSNSLYVGYSGTGTLNINGGIVSDYIGNLGYWSSSTGIATVSSGRWINSNSLWVGVDGKGTLNINGGTVSDPIGYVDGLASMATVSSGTWSSSSSLYVGKSGTGTLNITGGTVSDSYGYLGSNAGSVGSATVSSGTWSNSDDLYVGSSGTGTLNVNGGTVTDINGYLGDAPGSNGAATVSSGTWSNASGLSVGVSGTGTLNLTGNGVVIIASGTGTLTLARDAISTGTLNIGTGGTAGTLSAAVVTGSSGLATVNFNHTGNITFAPRLTGTMTVNKLGAGTTTLTGSNSYTGLTTVSDGTLAFDVSEKLTGGLNIGTSGTAVLTAHTGGAANVKVLDITGLTISGTTPFVGGGDKAGSTIMDAIAQPALNAAIPADVQMAGGGLGSSAPVPEPGTIGLLAVGGAVAALMRRRAYSSRRIAAGRPGSPLPCSTVFIGTTTAVSSWKQNAAVLTAQPSQKKQE